MRLVPSQRFAACPPQFSSEEAARSRPISPDSQVFLIVNATIVVPRIMEPRFETQSLCTMQQIGVGSQQRFYRHELRTLFDSSDCDRIVKGRVNNIVWSPRNLAQVFEIPLACQLGRLDILVCSLNSGAGTYGMIRRRMSSGRSESILCGFRGLDLRESNLTSLQVAIRAFLNRSGRQAEACRQTAATCRREGGVGESSEDIGYSSVTTLPPFQLF